MKTVWQWLLAIRTAATSSTTSFVGLIGSYKKLVVGFLVLVSCLLLGLYLIIFNTAKEGEVQQSSVGGVSELGWGAVFLALFVFVFFYRKRQGGWVSFTALTGVIAVALLLGLKLVLALVKPLLDELVVYTTNTFAIPVGKFSIVTVTVFGLAVVLGYMRTSSPKFAAWAGYDRAVKAATLAPLRAEALDRARIYSLPTLGILCLIGALFQEIIPNYTGGRFVIRTTVEYENLILLLFISGSFIWKQLPESTGNIRSVGKALLLVGLIILIGPTIKHTLQILSLEESVVLILLFVIVAIYFYGNE